tara:strand:- start:31 stop:966 length:936 start_codon:yes stop_codon:yes gene_type:complete
MPNYLRSFFVPSMSFSSPSSSFSSLSNFFSSSEVVNSGHSKMDSIEEDGSEDKNKSIFQEPSDDFDRMFPSANKNDGYFIGSEISSSISDDLETSLNLPTVASQICLNKQGTFVGSSSSEYFKRYFYKSLFFAGLVCSSLKQYLPSLAFWLDQGKGLGVEVNTQNINFKYWVLFLLCIPCAFSQAGLAIQSEKPYFNNFKQILLSTNDKELLGLYGDKKHRCENISDLAKSTFRNTLVFLMAFTGVVSQTYWIGAQLWVLPYFEKDLGFEKDMKNYFYYYNQSNHFDPKFIFSLLVTFCGAIGYWNQLEAL